MTACNKNIIKTTFIRFYTNPAWFYLHFYPAWFWVNRGVQNPWPKIKWSRFDLPPPPRVNRKRSNYHRYTYQVDTVGNFFDFNAWYHSNLTTILTFLHLKVFSLFYPYFQPLFILVFKVLVFKDNSHNKSWKQG